MTIWEFAKMHRDLTERLGIYQKIINIQKGIPQWQLNLSGTYQLISKAEELLKYNDLIRLLGTDKQMNSPDIMLDPGKEYNSIEGSKELSSFSYDFSEIGNSNNDTAQAKIILDDTCRLKRIIADIYKDNRMLLAIGHREFEEVIGELLRFQGFEVELTKQTRDNGYDIIALKKLDGFAPLKFLVECKKYTTDKIGVEIIRSFRDVIRTENANRGILVTTSYFSLDAEKKKIDMPYQLEFKDRDNVLEWVQDYMKSRISLMTKMD